MKEKLIFVMPDSLEELLYASVIVSQYLISRLVMNRNADQVVFVCRLEELYNYLRACWGWAEVVREPTKEQLEQADLIFEFDAERAYRMTDAVKKHISEGFANQLGVGLMRFLPPVLVEDVKEVVGQLLMVERNEMDVTDDSWIWPHANDFYNMLISNGVPCNWLSKEASWEETRTLIGQSSVVIGVRSSATIVAAASNRIVLELTPNEKAHKEWVRKKECRTARMIYGQLSSMTPAFVWAQLEKLIKEAKGWKPRMAGVESVNV